MNFYERNWKKIEEIQHLSNVSRDTFFAVENSIGNHNFRSEC